MSSRKITVETWQDVRSLLPKGDYANKNFIELISRISDELINDNLNYVYHLKLSFGDKIIDKGKIFKDDIDIVENDFGKNLNDFKSDVLYSDDPLGIVLSNNVEVFTENKSEFKKGKASLKYTYTLPLNRLYPGDLFGVFGTLDKISGIHESNNSRDWYARAGTISFGLAFPFHNDLEQNKLIPRGRYIKLSGGETFIEQTPGDNKVEFIRDHIKDWEADIIYLPKHYYIKIPDDLKERFLSMLYDIGWKQSAPLRNYLFEDTTIYNLILNSNLRVNHDKHSLWLFYNFIIKAVKGETIVLKPLLDKNHVVSKAIEAFCQSNKEYLNLKVSFLPLPFIFGTLNDKNDWGIVSINHLPIIFNYCNISLDALLNDFNTINDLINKDINSSNRAKYILPEIAGFGNTGGKDGLKVSKTDDIKEILSKHFGIDKGRINLHSREFSNLLLIKNII